MDRTGLPRTRIAGILKSTTGAPKEHWPEIQMGVSRTQWSKTPGRGKNDCECRSSGESSRGSVEKKIGGGGKKKARWDAEGKEKPLQGHPHYEGKEVGKKITIGFSLAVRKKIRKVVSKYPS